MKVPYLDLSVKSDSGASALDEAWSRVTRRGAFILGPEVDAFEREFALYCGVQHCVGVGNGMDALRLVFEAVGIGGGDEVIVPAYTAVATWMAVNAVGATPVGVDVDAESYNLDPALAARRISKRTRAIVAVHLFGRPAPIADLKVLADQHGLLLIEDAAQAHGARVGGRRVGSLATAAAFSFYPTKNLGALGDGGAVTTDDAELSDRIRMLRAYGWQERSRSQVIGWNSRLDELQAALLRVRLRKLDDGNERRRLLAKLYATQLAGISGLRVGHEQPDTEAVWHILPIDVSNREELAGALRDADIETLVHYDPLPHLTDAYRAKGWKNGDFPIAERLAASELSLPLHPGLADKAVEYVSERIRRTLSRTSA